MDKTQTLVQGQAVRIPMFARNAAGTALTRLQAATHHTRPEDPAPRIVLSEDLLSEERICELLGSDNPNHRRLALNALSDRMQMLGDLISGRQTVLAANSNFPDVQKEGLPVAVELTDANRQRVDFRWPALFNIQDRRTEPFPGYFKVRNLYHAVSVKRYLPGERIELGFIEAAETILEHYLYGTGLQWNELLMAGRWDRQEGVNAMLTKWANNLAKMAYATLTASGLSTTAYDTTGASQIEKDINTINKAALEVTQAIYQKTAPKGGQQTEEIVPEDAPFYLLYNNHTAGYFDRITAALQVKYNIAQQGGVMTIKEVNRPIVPLASPYIPTGAWYLVLPNRLNIFSNFRDLRFYDLRDVRIAGIAEEEIGWGAFRFIRGDVDQVRQVALS